MGIFNFLNKKPPAEHSSICDYTKVCSNQEAEHYYKTKQLGKLHLIGLAFGGDDSPFNILYAPQQAVTEKEQIDADIESLLKQGVNLQYRAFPEYKGNSFIPSKIIIEVDGDQTYIKEINIW